MVNIYKLKFTKLQQEILKFLMINAGKSFNARNIAKSLEVSQVAISKALPKLVNENLVNMQKNKETKRLSIELNRDNNKVINLKRVENLKLIYESKINELLSEKFPGSTIILFGSYSFGEDTSLSDIDIAIIGAKPKNIILKNFEEKLKRTITINFYPNLKEIKKNLKENILNGILLKGSIEL